MAPYGIANGHVKPFLHHIYKEVFGLRRATTPSEHKAHLGDIGIFRSIVKLPNTRLDF